MGYYSRKHYRMVSPPADTKEEIAERLRHRSACEQAVKDREAKHPVITVENAVEVMDYQEMRIQELLNESRRIKR